MLFVVVIYAASITLSKLFSLVGEHTWDILYPSWVYHPQHLQHDSHWLSSLVSSIVSQHVTILSVSVAGVSIWQIYSFTVQTLHSKMSNRCKDCLMIVRTKEKILLFNDTYTSRKKMNNKTICVNRRWYSSMDGCLNDLLSGDASPRKLSFFKTTSPKQYRTVSLAWPPLPPSESEFDAQKHVPWQILNILQLLSNSLIHNLNHFVQNSFQHSLSLFFIVQVYLFTFCLWINSKNKTLLNKSWCANTLHIWTPHWLTECVTKLWPKQSWSPSGQWLNYYFRVYNNYKCQTFFCLSFQRGMFSKWLKVNKSMIVYFQNLHHICKKFGQLMWAARKGISMYRVTVRSCH